VAVMVPLGVVAVHFPAEEREGEMVVMGVLVWRLGPGATARESRCVTNLKGQRVAAVKVKQPTQPFTPET
jgi:hypothetical protein